MSSFIHLGPRGVNFDQLSEAIKPIDLGKAEGRFLQIKIVNKRGRCVVRSVYVQANLAGKNMDTKEGKPSR
jgi:hypothetical protein